MKQGRDRNKHFNRSYNKYTLIIHLNIRHMAILVTAMVVIFGVCPNLDHSKWKIASQEIAAFYV